MPDEISSGARLKEDGAPCIGCGLCCDGTLFDHGVVAKGEEPRLLRHGMELVTRGDKKVFMQPCRSASCGQCTNYQDRFDVCRSFRCRLLKRYQAGEVTLAEARATVGKAVELVAAVKADDPDLAQLTYRRSLRAQLTEQMQTSSNVDRRALGRRLLAIVALDEFLDTRFRRQAAEPKMER